MNQSSSLLREVLEKHLLRTVPRKSGCIEWLGAKQPSGYGNAWAAGKTWGAHRLFYTAFVGPIPRGMIACHKCDNPSCVRPDHIFIGSQSDNLVDSSRKGRRGIRRNANAEKTHCKRGHVLSGNNLYTRVSGARSCNTCRRMRDVASIQKKR